MTRAEFAEAASTFCALTGGSVTSWTRSLSHNTAVGGVKNSAHLFGLAVDVVYDAPQPLPAATERARRLGLKLIREGDHDHLQPATWEKG
jgi:hypothetical protein